MSLFNFIKTQLPILDIVSEYATLKNTGHYWKGHCPFHGEKTASFTVSPHKEIFYCFGCHATGDVIGFVAMAEHCSQIEAAKFLIERYNLKVPEDINKELNTGNLNSNDDKKRYYSLCKAVSNWCAQNLQSLTESSETKKYLKKRKFSQDSINKFSIGYFPSGQNSIKSLLTFVNKEGFLAKDLIHANILMEGKSVIYSPFEERIMFPIKDQLGRFCGFGGRIYKENDERAKYYNSHENIYFNKGSLLFGLELAKKSIQEKGYVFLVEGYTDCIAMAQSGYENTIATLGTACTIEHLKILTRFAQQIYILYDGDNAGQKAILRLTELCWNVNLELKVICLPENEDPASFLNKNNSLQEFINNAKDIYSFFIENSSKSFINKTLHEKICTLKKVIDIIRNIDNHLKRDILLLEAANILNIPFESLKNELNNLIENNNNIKAEDEDNNNEDNNNKDISYLEKKIFTAIMNNYNLLTEEYYCLINYFASPIKEILNKLINLKNTNKNLEFKTLFVALDESEKQFINSVMFDEEQDLADNFKHLILQFQKKNWKNITFEVKKQIEVAQQNADIQAVKTIINNFQALKNKLINGGINEKNN